MATNWTGSIDLLAGQVAIVQTRVGVLTGDSFMLRLSVPELSFSMDFAYTGDKFLYESPAGENPMSVEAVDEYPVEKSYSFRVRFVALADGPMTADLLITAGDAALETPSITAE